MDELQRVRGLQALDDDPRVVDPHVDIDRLIDLRQQLAHVRQRDLGERLRTAICGGQRDDARAERVRAAARREAAVAAE